MPKAYECIRDIEKYILEKETETSCTYRNKPGESYEFGICNMCEPSFRKGMRVLSRQMFDELKAESYFYQMVSEDA